MTCAQGSEIELSGYNDGELPPERRRWWEQHLGQCPACRAEMALLRALGAALKRDMPPREPSSAFRDELRRRLRAERPEPTRVRFPLPRWGAALAAGLVFAVGFGLGHQAGGTGAGDTVVNQVVAGHVRSLEADHLVDVGSAEQHGGNAGVRGQLDFL